MQQFHESSVIVVPTANRKFAEKCFSSSHNLPHCKLTVDAEEESTPQAEISDEVPAGQPFHI